MFRSLLSRVRAGRAPGPPADPWQQAWDQLEFLRPLAAPQRDRLLAIGRRFVEEKPMAGAGGLELTGPIQAAIALQACLPVLELGLHWYRGWSGIVVYPSEFVVARRIEDDHGLVHEFEDQLSGESWPGGPVVLSWKTVDPAPRAGHPFNVVIHEFAHKLDQLSEAALGRPPFDRHLHPGLDPLEWDAARDDAFDRLNEAVDMAEADIPDHIDPESPEADAYFAALPLDPYAAQDPAEFFAVSSEAFFTGPGRLFEAFPKWYSLLAAFYRQDPLAR